MAKYSIEMKIVKTYLNDESSYNYLAKKYGVLVGML